MTSKFSDLNMNYKIIITFVLK